MICAGFLNVAPWKSQTGQGNETFHRVPEEAKVSLDEAKKSTGSGFTGCVTKGCIFER